MRGSAPGASASFRGYLVGTALVLALFGYSAVALLLPTGEEGGSAPTILFRAASAAVFCAAYLAVPRAKGFRAASLWPLHLFLALYALRLFDNFFLRHFVWFAEPAIAFGLLLGSAWLPALLLPPLLPLQTQRSFVVPMMAACGVFLLGVLLNLDAFRSPDIFFGRVGTQKLNPISLGAAATSMALFLLLWRNRAWWITLAQYVAVGGFLVVALLTQSRGPLIATAVCLVLLLTLSRGETRRRLTRLALLGLVVSAAGMASFVHDIAAVGFQRFLFSDGVMDDSAMGRVQAWSAAWEQFLAGPLIGDRVFEPVMLRYPHNLFMETLISLGLVGATILVVYLAISLRATIWLLRRPDTPPYVVFVAISFVKDLIQAQFSGAVYTNTTVWVASACTIALHSAYRRDVRRRKLAVRMANAMPVQASAWDPQDLVYENLPRAPR